MSSINKELKEAIRLTEAYLEANRLRMALTYAKALQLVITVAEKSNYGEIIAKEQEKDLILSFQRKVNKICKDTLSKMSCLKCILWLEESPFGLEGNCMKRNIGDLSSDQLVVYIDKVLGYN